jgi:hypothetical protein
VKPRVPAVRANLIRVSSFARALRLETRSRFFQGDRTILTVEESIQIARALAASWPAHVEPMKEVIR